MLYRSRWRCFRGVVTPSHRALFLFGRSKKTELHRLSRQRPWWESAAIFTGLLVFMNAMSVLYYVLNRWYHAWRPSGNDIYVKDAINAKLFSRPDLAVAAVHMTAQHALARSSRPFGAPMIAPESCRPEAEELADFVLDLRREQPAFSVPDLWALLSTRALARIGGPHETPTRGRAAPARSRGKVMKDDETTEEGGCVPVLRREDVLAFAPSPVVETRRDVLTLKRVLASQGFTAGQIVALMGCVRGTGFHAAAGYHTREEVKPASLRGGEGGSSETTANHMSDIWQKCTPDPFVFSSTYFDLLLDYNWVEVKEKMSRWSSSTRGLGVFRCRDDNRRRRVTLLDPFSERVDEMRRTSSPPPSCSAGSADGEDMVVRRGETGRSGEAVTLAWTALPAVDSSRPRATHDESGMGGVDKQDQSEYVTVNSPDFTDPCPMISMQGIDMALLDDALTRGWVYRFSADEPELYSVLGDVMADIQRRGYNPTTLHPWV